MNSQVCVIVNRWIQRMLSFIHITVMYFEMRGLNISDCNCILKDFKIVQMDDKRTDRHSLDRVCE